MYFSGAMIARDEITVLETATMQPNKKVQPTGRH